jgi:DNA-binding CsgD family transcriptional regulator/tetratricopeptide (TPR) repeat protein
MELLERGEELATLDGCLADAAGGGAGRLVLLAGEAGVGKTSVARAFCDRHRERARIWWGACDALATPSPLAPLRDIARDHDEVADLLVGDQPRHQLFAGVLNALVSPLRPAVVVVDDVHWADEATLDLLLYLGRRIVGTHAVVVVAYRDDEVGPAHPLRRLLGHLAGLSHVRRLGLARLSCSATAALAEGRPVDPAYVYRVTSGNPFFVTELLAAAPDAVPATVSDAVLARAAPLSPRARAVLDLVAVTPGGAELALVDALVGDGSRPSVDEGVLAGLLQVNERTVGFRHELARQALAAHIPATRSPDLHASVLAHLTSAGNTDAARLAYHAAQAGDRHAVLTHAPAAATQASRQGAHRQAVAHYELALRHAGELPAPARAPLLEGYADECNATGQLVRAIDALDEAARLHDERGAVDDRAMAMARRAQYLHATGDGKEANHQLEQALALVDGHPATPAVASVYAHAAYLSMVRGDRASARRLGPRAVALAERFGDYRLHAVALIAVGGAQWWTSPEEAEANLVRAVEAAHASGRTSTVAIALVGLGVGALDARRFRVADRWLAEAADWCERHDLDKRRDTCRANLAVSHLRQGRWDEAAELAGRLAAPDADTYLPAARNARRTLARLAIRRGKPGHRAALVEAWEIAVRAGDQQLMCLAAAARAEAVWCAGQPARIPELIGDTLPMATQVGDPWLIGEIGFWLWRAGTLHTVPAHAAEPYALHIDGQPLAAAQAWDAIGCPYEAAMARADTDEPAQLRAALATFYRLGARPAANRLARRMRQMGITELPRRPHRTTGGNPAGLTDREVEIVGLLAAGLSNADIAAALHISRHTTAHHVSAALSKLGVGSRRAAAEAAQRLGIAAPDRSVERPA